MAKKFWLLALAPVAVALALGACKSDDDDDDDKGNGSGATSATAEVKDKAGTKLGTAVFKKDGDKVKLVVTLTNVETKGAEVGLHIHQKPTCDASTEPPFKDAGDHWNPGKMDGDYGPSGSSPDTGYLGELGKISVDADGKATREISTPNWTIGTGKDSDVVGRAIILHAVDPDPADGKPAPRQACGAVAADKSLRAGGRLARLAGGRRRV